MHCVLIAWAFKCRSLTCRLAGALCIMTTPCNIAPTCKNPHQLRDTRLRVLKAEKAALPPSTPLPLIPLYPWLYFDTWLISVLWDSAELFLSKALLREDLCFKWFMSACSLSVGIFVFMCVSWHGRMHVLHHDKSEIHKTNRNSASSSNKYCRWKWKRKVCGNIIETS